jgi:hypothetical protein
MVMEENLKICLSVGSIAKRGRRRVRRVRFSIEAVKRLVTDSDSASVRLLMARMERLSALYGRVSGVAAEPHAQLEDALAKLPESAMDDLAVIVQQLGTMN